MNGEVKWQVPEWRVDGVQFTPDGGRLLVGSEWGSGLDIPRWGVHSDLRYRTRCLDSSSGQLLWEQPDQPGFLFTVSGEGRWAAVTAGSGQRLIRLDDGTTMHDLGESSLPLVAPLFSADGARVAVGAARQVQIFELQSGTVAAALALPDRIVALGDLFDGTVAALCRGGQLVTFDLSTGATLGQSALEAGGVQLGYFGIQLLPPAGFSPDGRRIAAFSRSGAVVSASGDGRRLTEAQPLKRDVSHHVCFSPDGRLVGSNRVGPDDQDGVGVTVLEAGTGAVVWQRPDAKVIDVGFTARGDRLVVVGNGFVRLHRLGTEPTQVLIGSPVSRVTVTGGIGLVGAIGSSPVASIFSVRSGELLLEKTHPGALSWIGFTPSGQTFATAGSSGGVWLYETVSGRKLWLVNHQDAIRDVAISPATGQWLATASADRTARLLAMDGGTERWQHRHPQSVTQVAISADDQFVATGCADRATRILDAATGAERFRLDHDAKIVALCFDLTGSLLAVASQDGTATVVDAATGQVAAQVTHPRAVNAVALSADGSLLASGGADCRVRLTALSAAEPALVRTLVFRTPVEQLAFSSADGTLAVRSEGRTVHVFDVDAGIETYRLVHPAGVRHVAFSGDGRLLATACEDGAARVYPTRVSDQGGRP
nr:PQQ-binding-like beta-propeller repeat protein [Microlunatus panaciterrae]